MVSILFKVTNQGSTTEIFGYVRYIIENSDASLKKHRRDFFNAVNGTQLTVSNYQSYFAVQTKITR
jgi:hypothetical protein